jgi:hypothetical protein
MKDLYTMKKILCIFLLLGFASQVFGTDLIETKKKRVYKGKIVKIVDDKVVIKTEEGSMIGISKSSLSKVTRGKEVFDFQKGERYYLEIRRPFLPFTVLSAACGVYSVLKFQDYKRNHNKYEKEKKDADAKDTTNLKDQSKKDLSTGIILAVCSVGTFIMAIKPMEVKVPIGKIKISMTSTGVGLALNF